MAEQKTAQSIELMDVEEAKSANPAMSDVNLALIKDVKVDLDLVIGSVELSVENLLALKVGEKIELDKDVDEPVTLVSDGKPVATGRLVAIDGCFGVEITEIKS